MKLYIPVRTESEANARDHWRIKAARTKAQREAACLAVRARRDEITLPAIITICRVAPRDLDCDNLRGAGKGVRDGIADALGLPNDRDTRVEWRYTQERGKPREYGVRVVIEGPD